MTVRRALPIDLPGILVIEQKGIENPWSASQLKAEFYHSSSLLFVARQNTLIQGYVSFRVTPPDAELLRLGVLAEQRRKGVGSHLVRVGLEMLDELGVQTCFLEVRDSNEQAGTLYDKLGFTRIGTRPKYYRQPMEDAIIMQMQLLKIDI